MTKTSLIMLALSVAACAGAPRTATQRENLEESAQSAVSRMVAHDPSLRRVLEDAPAYVVFPSIGQAGAVVGGAYGRGILYEDGRSTGYVELSQASLGLQLGGQTFAELIVINDPATVRDFKTGTFTFGADASAVLLTAGAAESTSFRDATTVFVMPQGGAYAGLTVNGQRISFRPWQIGAPEAG